MGDKTRHTGFEDCVYVWMKVLVMGDESMDRTRTREYLCRRENNDLIRK